jgi:hypothetical protein
LERNSCSGTLNAGSILLNIWGSNVWKCMHSTIQVWCRSKNWWRCCWKGLPV